MKATREASDLYTEINDRTVARRVVNGVGSQTLAAIVGILGGLGSTILAAHVVGTKGFATYVVAISTFIIAPFAPLGVSQNATRRIPELVARREDGAALAFGRSIAFAVGTIAPFGSLMIAAAVLLTRPEDPLQILLSLTINVFLECVRMAASNVLVSHERQAASAATTSQVRALFTAVLLAGLVIAHVHTSVVNVLWMLAGIQLIFTSVAVLVVLRYIRTDRHGPPLREMMKDSFPFVFIACGTYVGERADVWVASAFIVSSARSAAYGAASTLAVQLVLPIKLLSVAVSPIIRSLWIARRRVELDAMLRALATVAGLASLLGAVLMSVIAAPLLTNIYGPSYGAGAAPLVILSVGSVLTVVTGLSGEALIMCVGQRAAAVVAMAWAVLTVVGLWVGASVWGLVGLAAFSTFAAFGLSATQVAIVWRQAGLSTLPALRVRELISAIRRPTETVNASP